MATILRRRTPNKGRPIGKPAPKPTPAGTPYAISRGGPSLEKKPYSIGPSPTKKKPTSKSQAKISDPRVFATNAPLDPVAKPTNNTKPSKPTSNVRAEVMPPTYKPTPTTTKPTGGRKKPSAGNPYGSGGGKPAMPGVTKKPTTKRPTVKKPMFGIKRRGDGGNR